MPDQDPTTPHADAPRHSPLHAVHESLGATFTDFVGWQMPVRYSSDLAEHKAVREAAGMFDVSHMGNISVRGAEAGAFLDYALSGQPSTLALMQARYNLLLDARGGIIDDVIVYHNADNEYFVVANAANRAVDLHALTERSSGFDVEVRDVADAHALIAVQGPAARGILESVAGLSILDGHAALDEVKYYRATAATWNDGTVFIGRTGYTGEDGFELWVDVADAVALWNAIAEAGESVGVTPCGLASRDSLRLEAGMPLYGNELGLDMHPAQAGLGRVVKYTKEGDFVGRAALEAADDADTRVLVGLVSEGRRAGRTGYPVVAGDAEVGTVTSGILSPTLAHPIALAFVNPSHSEPGTEVDIDVRGKRIPATVTPLPFYSRKK